MEIEIINHFGLRNQLKKFNEECYELIEAINDYESQKAVCLEFCKELHCDREMNNIIEEMADVLVLLSQFIEYYKIDDLELASEIGFKLNRTIERIESGYYERLRK